MSIINHGQQLSLMSQSGKEQATKVIDLVHIKLGTKAFTEVVECKMSELDEFFWKYLKFEMIPGADPVAELVRIENLLKQLPDHHDIFVVKQIEKNS